METKDIIGKEFIGIKFEGDGRLTYDTSYNRFQGKIGKIINFHDTFPEYVNVDFGDGNYRHFPTELVKKQVEENEVTEDINVVLARIERLTR
jgi:hypothetical protein